ncbi:GNAT family N-acetyltransferase [Microbacterium sp. STN6]|uniref:GNAT family N-acetyltransferase n=1 Tax=Microbacterium sp. STN6 TaxID=2995588 RepID=UPI002260843A|nr:GNAT family N-acetyltransferase [Microbacterium sp. STN6]MCX7520845.1 GNAT family N-acetyltransferase [Microbacterium sp. STN6]
MTATIRPYRPEDHDDVYDVCLRTAAVGKDATGIYSSDDLMPDVYAGPYIALEPELAFVVDTGERVSGYIIAAANTREFVERYRRDWVPVFASRHPRQAERESEQWLVDAGYRPERMLISEVDEYPAHLHIDLLPGLQGQSLGRQLVRTLLGALRERGVPRLHLGMSPDNVSARAFYDRVGFHELPSSTPRGPLLGIATDAPV